MPLPQPMLADTDPCEFGTRWGLRLDVATLALALARAIVVNPELQGLLRGLDLIKMISGFRTAEEQEALRQSGRPSVAADNLSTHRSCPSTGFDMRVEGLMNPDNDPQAVVAWRIIGALAKQIGLRWGGGSRVNARTGLPIDFNHFDVGPRR